MKNEAYYQAYLSHHHISRRGLLRHVFPATKSTIEKNAVSSSLFSTRRFIFRRLQWLWGMRFSLP